jgi:hypothetical protein
LCPVVTLIFGWRVTFRLSVPTIAWRLNGDLAAFPPPGDGPGWTESSVSVGTRPYLPRTVHDHGSLG